MTRFSTTIDARRRVVWINVRDLTNRGPAYGILDNVREFVSVQYRLRHRREDK